MWPLSDPKSPQTRAPCATKRPRRCTYRSLIVLQHQQGGIRHTLSNECWFSASVKVTVHFRMDADIYFNWKSASYFKRKPTCTLWKAAGDFNPAPTSTLSESRCHIWIGADFHDLKVGSRFEPDAYFHFIWKSVPILNRALNSTLTDIPRPIWFGRWIPILLKFVIRRPN